MSSLKLALVAAIVLVLVGPAAAGGRVDWSDYIDRDAKPSAPVAQQESSPAPEAPARTKTAKASRAKKKVARTKTKASKKARKGKARRK